MMFSEHDPDFRQRFVEGNNTGGEQQLYRSPHVRLVQRNVVIFAGKCLSTLLLLFPAMGCEGRDMNSLAREPHSVVLGKHPRRVDAVVFSPDGKTVVSGGSDGTAKIWDAVSLRNLHTLKWGTWVQSVAYSPDGRLLAAGGSLQWLQKGERTTTAVGLWKGITGDKIIDLRADPLITSYVYSVAFSPDGQTLAAGNSAEFITRRCPVFLWDVPSGKLRRTLEGDMYIVYAVQFSPDGKTLATGGYAGDEKSPSLKLWDVATGKVKMEFKGLEARVLPIAFSPDGKMLASGGGETKKRKDITELILWDVAEGKRLAALEGHRGPVHSVKFSHDGKLLVSGGGDPFFIKDELFLWDVKKLKEITRLKGHRDLVTSVDFSPDDTLLVSGSSDCTVRLWYLRDKPPAKDKQDP